MGDSKPKNIFEAASQSKKPMKAAAPATQKSNVVKNVSSPKPVIPADFKIKESEMRHYHDNPEINYMFNVMFQMQDDIDSKMNKLYDRGGLTPNQIKNYLDNPDNFPPDIWAKIQNQRLQLENKVRGVLKKPPKEQATATAHKPPSNKERKAKTLGARKNWIPM